MTKGSDTRFCLLHCVFPMRRRVWRYQRCNQKL